MTPIERVARAIGHEHGKWWLFDNPSDAFNNHPEEFILMAKAVIKALMEPSQGMIEAMQNADGCVESLEQEFINIWQAALCAALEEKE